MSETGSFCEHCGSRVDLDAVFCESCGASTEVRDGAGAPPGCPKCLQNDQTISAEAFIRLDLSEAPREENGLDPETAQQYLGRPEMPQPPSRLFWAVIPFIPVVNAIAIWFAPMHRVYKFVMLGIAVVFVYCVAVPELYERGDFAWPVLALLAVYYGGLILDRKRKNAEFQEKLLPQYRRMEANWSQLQYCRRCEAAWLSSAPSRCVAVSETEDLLRKS